MENTDSENVQFQIVYAVRHARLCAAGGGDACGEGVWENARGKRCAREKMRAGKDACGKDA
ncbi:MAG: hypothetical protein RR244_05060, partial [Oscillospiraceae bacterium]